MKRTGNSRVRERLLGAAFSVALLSTVSGCGDDRATPPSETPDPSAETDPPADLPAGFVGSETCRECHEDRHGTWSGTGHAYSFRHPDGDSVVGQFDGRPVEIVGGVVTPYKLVDQYRMAVESDGGLESGDFVVSRVIGRTFEQGYLTRGPNGGSRLLPLSYSIERGEWDGTARVLADVAGVDARVIAGRGAHLVFEDGCAQCHATGFDAGYDAVAKTYDSRMVEGAIGCETCHGPGAEHSDWHSAHRRDGAARPESARLLDPGVDLDRRAALDACARCHFLHEWRFAIDDDPRVGHADLAMTRNFVGESFFADGRIAGLAYHGTTMSQSACFLEGGMSCLHCHDLHGENPRALRWPEPTDAQCLPCHREEVEHASGHSHHDATLCVDCHMPSVLTGVLHGYHDHSLGSPEPVLTERVGADLAPNACNVCHAGETPAWARRKREEWWGATDVRRVARVELMALLRRSPRAVSQSALVELARDASARPFFRNSALVALRDARFERPFASVLPLLDDGSDEIRQLLCEGLFERPDAAAIGALWGHFDDPVRTVRVEAVAAAAAAGWRGQSAALLVVHADALRMLERRRPDTASLERVLVITDLVDDGATFDAAWDAWTRKVDLDGSRWGTTWAGIVVRRARRLLDAGQAAEALRLCRAAEKHAEGATLTLVRLDLAEALAEESDVDGQRAALTPLRDADESLAALIARWRLARASGSARAERADLDAAVARATEALGELRRRATAR